MATPRGCEDIFKIDLQSIDVHSKKKKEIEE